MLRLEARNSAYEWLAAKMGLTREECHMGLFDAEMCERVIAICREYRSRKYGDDPHYEIKSSVGSRR